VTHARFGPNSVTLLCYGIALLNNGEIQQLRSAQNIDLSSSMSNTRQSNAVGIRYSRDVLYKFEYKYRPIYIYLDS